MSKVSCPKCNEDIVVEVILHDRSVNHGHKVRMGQETAKMLGKKIGRPQVVDRDRIKNLRMAGGTLQSIADEMKINIRTVLKTLKDLREKGEIQ